MNEDSSVQMLVKRSISKFIITRVLEIWLNKLPDPDFRNITLRCRIRSQK